MMQKLTAGMKWMISMVVVLAVTATAMLGTTLYFALRPNTAQILMENVYKSNFYQLTTAMDSIEENMAILSVASSAESQQKIASRIWRQTGEASACLSGLPVNHTQLTEAYVLLNRLGGYLYSLSEKLTTGESLQAAERAQIGTLYEETARITAKLVEVREGMTNYSFFDHMDETSTAPIGYAWDDCECPEIDYTGDFSALNETADYSYLDSLEEVTPEVALARAKELLTGLDEVTAPTSTTEGTPVFFVFDTEEGMLEVSKSGGLIATLTMRASDGEADWQADDAQSTAMEFVEKAYGGKFVLLQTQVSKNVATLCFAPLKDAVTFENRIVKIGVDLATRRIIGVDARNFFGGANIDLDYTPSVTTADAAMSVYESLADRFVRLAVIVQNTKPRLVYEFSGTVKNRAYLVRVDAHTGREIDLMRLSDDVVI